MKLSAAIRIGSMTTRQIIGKLSDGANGRCAIGAAADIGGCLEECSKTGMYGALGQVFPIANRIVERPDDPAYPDIIIKHKYTVMSVMWMLNDICKWSREQIADWVETVECAADREALCANKDSKVEVVA